MLFVLLGVLGTILWRERSTRRPPVDLAIVLFGMMAWAITRVSIIRTSGASLGECFALIGWYLLPALVLYGTRSGEVELYADTRLRDSLGKGLEVGVGAAGCFSIIQLIFGIEQTKIPGLTLAIGDSYASKPLLIHTNGYETFSKIPSTYQNGNVLGPVAGFILIIALARLVQGKKSTQSELVYSAVILCLATTACLLSGSRTVVLAVCLSALLALLQGRLKRKLPVLVGTGAVLLVALQLQPGLAGRFAPSSLLDTEAAGRTDNWKRIVGEGIPFRLLIGSEEWLSPRDSVEGLLGALQRVGVVGLSLYCLLIWRAVLKGQGRHWRVPCMVLLVAFALDSSYLVFPTLFIPFARTWALPQPRNRPSDNYQILLGHGGHYSGTLDRPLVAGKRRVTNRFALATSTRSA